MLSARPAFLQKNYTLPYLMNLKYLKELKKRKNLKK